MPPSSGKGSPVKIPESEQQKLSDVASTFNIAEASLYNANAVLKIKQGDPQPLLAFVHIRNEEVSRARHVGVLGRFVPLSDLDLSHANQVLCIQKCDPETRQWTPLPYVGNGVGFRYARLRLVSPATSGRNREGHGWHEFSRAKQCIQKVYFSADNCMTPSHLQPYVSFNMFAYFCCGSYSNPVNHICTLKLQRGHQEFAGCLRRFFCLPQLLLGPDPSSEDHSAWGDWIVGNEEKADVHRL